MDSNNNMYEKEPSSLEEVIEDRKKMTGFLSAAAGGVVSFIASAGKVMPFALNYYCSFTGDDLDELTRNNLNVIGSFVLASGIGSLLYLPGKKLYDKVIYPLEKK